LCYSIRCREYWDNYNDWQGNDFLSVWCLLQGNFSVLQSPDEYSVNVESSRGLKEFTFDRVFMPENTQDQVFEDTYVSARTCKNMAT